MGGDYEKFSFGAIYRKDFLTSSMERPAKETPRTARSKKNKSKFQVSKFMPSGTKTCTVDRINLFILGNVKPCKAYCSLKTK